MSADVLDELEFNVHYKQNIYSKSVTLRDSKLEWLSRFKNQRIEVTFGFFLYIESFLELSIESRSV